MIEIPSYFWLDQCDTPFPDLSLALKEPNGLIAIGGEMSIERLLDAYSKGIFPWYREDETILWYSPCLLYTSPSPRDATLSRMPSSA